ncbi:MAG: sn-glycerol-1-phosphate dehydrogenase [Acutalibacteraceae bacterium]|nr:sn-glycerol-1-phosphate dehydrogenase [Acutalibacteraceae bacterium]
MFEKLNKNNCRCGKAHTFTSKIVIENGAINRLPDILEQLNYKSAFVIADKNTYSAAGEKVIDVLESAGIKTKKYIYSKENLEPDETNVGLAVMNFDPAYDVVIGVGSGVINDISKIVANVSGKKYIIVGTAPSMDGYASATSSMTMEGLKISLNSKCADIIIGDIDVLCNAPIKMMISGLGDMLAKYVSICEWRISNLINGEYYCEDIANLVRDSLKKCVDNAEGLLNKDEGAVKSVFEGLINCGAAMKFAGLSRPASGIEHYLSHIWDMRGVEFGTSVEFHGIQCAVGTLIAIKLYKKIINITPDKEKALKYVKNFDFVLWSEQLREFLGKGCESMIALEEKEQKYNVESHKQRLDIILDKWNEIIKIIEEELPEISFLEDLFDNVGIPKTMKEIGIDDENLPMTFKSAKDIRDKYVLPRLCWDLGIIDEILES